MNSKKIRGNQKQKLRRIQEELIRIYHESNYYHIMVRKTDNEYRKASKEIEKYKQELVKSGYDMVECARILSVEAAKLHSIYRKRFNK